MRLEPRFIQHYDRHANAARESSKDSTKVGAVLVGISGEVLGTAFNGPPIGVHDTLDRFQRPLKYDYASHAEQNLLAFCAKYGIRTHGLGIYTSHEPCPSCAKSIIQAGIKCVIVGNGTWVSQAESDKEATRNMFRESGVFFRFSVNLNVEGKH